MHGASPDPFVLEMRELARLIALARAWVRRGQPAAHGEIRARRTVERPGERFSRAPLTRAGSRAY